MKSELHDSQIPYFLQFQRPLLIFLGLLYLDRPASVNELCWLLNASEPTIRRDLSILRRFEAIQPAGRGRFQAIKPVPTSSDFGKFFMKFFTKTLFNTTDSDSFKEDLIGLSSSSTKSLKIFSKINFKTPAPGTPEVASLQSIPQPKAVALLQANLHEPDLEVEPDATVIKTLQAAGIFGIKQAELTLKPHITPEYVSGWEVYLKEHRGERNSTGLLIHVLESAQPLPEEKVNGHPQDCTCRECDPHYYARCYFCKQYPCVCGENPVES
jgi:hypothetical protein